MKKSIIIIITIIFVIVTLLFFFFKSYKKQAVDSSKFYNINSVWVDSLIKNMSIEQKIGSLIFYNAGKISNTNINKVDNLVSNYKIGGLIFECDSTKDYINIVNKYNEKAEIPLLFILKQSNSYPNFLSDITNIPNQLTIDAINNDSLSKKLLNFRLLGYKNLGVNFSFLPNHYEYNKQIISNDLNNIIKFNSDSILSCIEIKNTNNFLINPELKNIIKSDVSSILINNDYKFDSVNNKFISDFYRDSLLFKGLIINNINNISQINDFINSKSDIILLNNDVEKAIMLLKELYSKELLSIDDLNNRVVKILKAKYWSGIKNKRKLDVDKAKKNLNSIKAKQLNIMLTEASVCLVKNSKNRIPIKNINEKIFIYNIGNNFSHFINLIKYYQKDFNYKNLKSDTFSIKLIRFNAEYNHFIFNLDLSTNDSASLKVLSSIIDKNNDKNITIINYNSVNSLNYLSKTNTLIQLFNNTKTEQELAAQVIFGGIAANGILPINLKNFDYHPLKTKKTRLGYTAPEEFLINPNFSVKIDSIIHDAIARYSFPGCQILVAKKGKVIFQKSYGYLTYANQVKVTWDDLYDIASVTKIAATTIATMKMVEQGKLNINKNIEKYYKDTHIDYTRIKTDTFIDIDTVNILKLSAAKLKKMINKNDTIHLTDSTIVIYDTVYWKATPKLNIFKRNVKEMLMHRSGLPPSMPILRYIMYAKDTNITLPDSFKVDYGKYIYFDTLKNFKDTVLYTFNKYFTRKYIKDTSTLQIARNIYLRKQYQDTLWIDTKQIKVYSKDVFMYSDVNPIIVQQTIDTINNYSIDKYLNHNFYKPLGCRTIGYLPLRRFKLKKIAPTEYDKYWRGQVIRGYVHDPSAALEGGIAGNAGIFSNSTDLAIIFQMLLNGGNYGGKNYLNYKTIRQFTDYQPKTARGIGFDKGSKKNIIAPSASPNSYGHTGFTGTCVWVDPDNELVYVFLSNRVQPSAKNWKINTLKIRQKVHQTVYDAIENGVK